MSDPRARMRELAAEYVRKGDQLSWFERLYQEGERGEAIVPWGDGTPNPHLVEFWQQHPLETGGKTALIIGSGFGDDAEQLAKWGFRTTGFDIAPSAIEQTKKRYPHSPVNYVLADLFDPPRAWIGAFDLVLEIYTIQSFAGDLRTKSIDAIARFVAPRGHLLVIARGRDESEPEVPGPPWPLTREELDGFQRAGLEVESFEDYADHEPPWVRRFRVLYHRLTPPQGAGVMQSAVLTGVVSSFASLLSAPLSTAAEDKVDFSIVGRIQFTVPGEWNAVSSKSNASRTTFGFQILNPADEGTPDSTNLVLVAYNLNHPPEKQSFEAKGLSGGLAQLIESWPIRQRFQVSESPKARGN